MIPFLKTVTEAKRFTDEGITVLIAPQLVKLFRGYAVPTFVQANVCQMANMAATKIRR